MLVADALIFDMDGLLIDSEPLWWRVEKQLAAAHDREWSDALAQSCVGTGLRHTIATMRRELELDIGLDEGVAWLVDTFIARSEELALKPGAEALLEAAKDKRVALASSSPLRLIDAVMARFAGVAARIELCVSGEQVAAPKPAPDVFLYTAGRLGVAPARCVVLEDSLAGVRAGVAAGMAVIAVPETDPARFSVLTPHVVGDLHEARALLAL